MARGSIANGVSRTCQKRGTMNSYSLINCYRTTVATVRCSIYSNLIVHCWNYREFIVQELLKQEPDVELKYCENLLGRDNDGLLTYSAFHYRSAMLRRKHAEEAPPLSDLLKDEWKLIANAIYTDAFNQSAWI